MLNVKIAQIGKPYIEEFEIPYRPALNVVAALMEIQKNPVTKDGKKTTPVVWECNCLEKVLVLV